jgi:hypothetical protein
VIAVDYFGSSVEESPDTAGQDAGELVSKPLSQGAKADGKWNRK